MTDNISDAPSDAPVARESTNAAVPSAKPWYTRIGPGLITACVVIGPGSIMTSSKIGASEGYSMLWIVAVSVAFMMVYMTLGAKLGAVAAEAPCDLIRRKAGKWLAIAVGIGVFFISAAFQSGNNIGVAAAFEAFIDSKEIVTAVIVGFNLLAISFLFVFKDIYRSLEKLMMCFVALMLVSFAVNLLMLQPSVVALAKGFVPSLGYEGKNDGWIVHNGTEHFGPFTLDQLKELGSRGEINEKTSLIAVGDRSQLLAAQVPGLFGEPLGSADSDFFSKEMLPLLGLIGTTFVITAAFYQAYLVRQKGWKVEDLKSGLVDARVGSVIMFLITMMLMSTAAAAFFRTNYPEPAAAAELGSSISLEGRVALTNPVSVASALEGTFGNAAKIIFCMGLFSAAYSSFLVNSMIGGFMAADGLGWGSRPTDRGPKIMTTAALLTGMSVGVAVLVYNFDRTPTIIAAQAATVVASPLVAGVLLWLTSSRDVMGDKVNGPGTIAFAGLGLLMLVAMAGKTAFVDLPQKIKAYRNPQPAVSSAARSSQSLAGNDVVETRMVTNL